MTGMSRVRCLDSKKNYNGVPRCDRNSTTNFVTNISVVLTWVDPTTESVGIITFGLHRRRSIVMNRT